MEQRVLEKEYVYKVNRILDEESQEVRQMKRRLDEEQRSIDRQKRELELEKREFKRRQELNKHQLDQEKKLFAMKWKLLEDELKKIAVEKMEVEKAKAFYARVGSDGKRSSAGSSEGVFFRGVDNELALKKRYRDLIKIFHPDNMDGDTRTIQEINKEYNEIKKQMCG